MKNYVVRSWTHRTIFGLLTVFDNEINEMMKIFIELLRFPKNYQSLYVYLINESFILIFLLFRKSLKVITVN